MDFGVAMVFLALQNFGVHVLEAPNFVLGLFPTLNSLCYAVCCLASGRLADRFGRRRLALVACGLSCIWWVLVPFSPSWRPTLVLVSLIGASLALYWPALQAWLADAVLDAGGNLTRAVGLFNIAWCLGVIVGPVVTGSVWAHNWRLAFWIPACVLLLLTVILYRTPEKHHRTVHDREAMPSDLPPQATPKTARVFLHLAWVGNFSVWFAGGTLLAFYPKLASTLDISTATVGFCLAAFRTGQLLVSWSATSTQRWQYRLGPLLLANGAGFCGLSIVFGAHRPVWFATGFCLLGACAGLTYASSLYYSLAGKVDDRGKNSGLHEAVLGSGGMLGPLLGGIAAQWIGLRAPFVLAALLFVLAAAVQIALHRRAYGQQPEPF